MKNYSLSLKEFKTQKSIKFTTPHKEGSSGDRTHDLLFTRQAL